MRSAILSAVLLGALALSSCGEVRVPINAVMPATRIDLAKQGVKRIAIGDITATVGDQTAEGAVQIGEDLRAALVDLNRFEILDRGATKSLLMEHKLNASGLVNESTAVAAGKFTGATALVLGTVTSYSGTSQVRTQTFPRGDGRMETMYQRVTNVAIAASFKLIDIETGRLIAVAPCAETFEFVLPKQHGPSGANAFSSSMPAEPDLTGLMGEMRKAVVNQFVHQIAPHSVVDEAVLENDSDLPSIAGGIKAAQIGEWAEAETIFLNATKAKPTSAAAFHDLGIAQRAQGKFAEASASFKAAFRIDGQKRYQSELEKTKQFAAGDQQK